MFLTGEALKFTSQQTLECQYGEMLQFFPGADYADVLETLERVRFGAMNTRSNRAPNIDFYIAYMTWAHDSVRILRYKLHAREINRLVATPRYVALLASPFPAARSTTDLIELELVERIEEIKDECAQLRRLRERWNGIEQFVVPETSMIMNYSWTLDYWDLAPLLDVGSDGIHLVIPLAVIDELDNLKDRGPDQARTRARASLRTIANALKDPRDIGTLREAGFTPYDKTDTNPRGAITLEVMFDNPGHTRLPRMDDEIVDRAMAVQDLAARPVIFMTDDTGQSMRASRAGLEVVMMPRRQDK
ncbi:PIN domain-containing protein [Microbispora rosea]|uniref:PIN domain-containing protein n=1 Tax=Microbispora rosea TaxID=58117 RepID=UPI0037C9D73B